MTAGGTHSLICGALWHTEVACHSAVAKAFLRTAAHSGIAATREPHVKQLPQRPRAMVLPALPNRPPYARSAGGHTPARVSFAIPASPHPTLASAPPSSLRGNQDPNSAGGAVLAL